MANTLGVISSNSPKAATAFRWREALSDPTDVSSKAELIQSLQTALRDFTPAEIAVLSNEVHDSDSLYELRLARKS